MKTIWAPWRMKYIKSRKTRGCVFCRAARSIKNSSSQVLYRGRHAFVIMNIYPYSNGHLMVVPVRHRPDIEKLTGDERSELMELTAMCTRALKKTYGPQGFNIGVNIGRAAGAGIPGHVHIHVVPRWTGDTNFMAAACDTKIIPESLSSAYRKLKKHFPRSRENK